MRKARVLPMLDPDASDGSVPDPERVATGWTFRFIAAGERAREMIALYQELDFEVAADAVTGSGPTDACPACFGGGEATHLAIYTR